MVPKEKMLVASSIMNVSRCKPILNFDSKYVIIAFGSDIKVFNILSGECIQTLKYHSSQVINLIENKNNILQIFSCSDDGFVVRWDYIDGKMLQVYNLQMQQVARFYAPTPSSLWFLTKKYEDHYRLYAVIARAKGHGCTNIERIMNPVLPDENTISFGYMAKFCASIFENTLTIYKFDRKAIIRHKTGDRNLTCVVCHPSEPILATGDIHGRVVLWSNALESNHPIRSVYHWHSLPLADLAFSSEGSHIYSGGGEAALVKWNTFSERKFILPRMGAPIAHISVSKDNTYVVTAHQDNVLQVVDSQRNIVMVIQGLTKYQPQYGQVLPTGLIYNSHLNALVLNGKPGHIQFYDFLQDRQLFNLDIAGKNFFSQERYDTVFNVDVQKAAIDDSGLWLATEEYWSNGITSPQIWLKFWLFDLEKQAFVLNTNIILPHNKELNCIVFRPHHEHLPMPCAATTSADGRFKIWTLSENPSDCKQSWICESMGCYRELPAGDACFSEDGSALAVSFKNVATLWDVDGMILKAVLWNDRSENDIKQLLFGRHACSHYLVCQDTASITVWNVLTLSIVWVALNEVQRIAVDPCSTNFAAFLANQSLLIFSPDQPKPSCTIQKISKTPVISCIFIPDGNACSSSKLIFMNESQNLITVTESEAATEKMSESRKKIVQNLAPTPFTMLQAEHKVSYVKKIDSEDLVISHEDTSIITRYQNPVALCESILQSLLIKIK